jgi:NADH-quinone oxidoreductase subunit N
MDEFAASAPLICLSLGAALVLLLTVAGGPQRPASTAFAHLAAVSLASLGAALYFLCQYTAPLSLFSGALLCDGLSTTFGMVTVFGAALTTLISVGYLHEHRLDHGEFLALMLLSSVGMLVMNMAGDLLVLFVGLEIMSLAVYILAGYRRAEKRSQEAALKYFIYGAFASGFVIYGSALLYGEVGQQLGSPSLRFADLHKAFALGQVGRLGWMGAGFVLGGLGFKIAAVPFHMWAPDVYEGAPTPSTAFMAVGVKVAAFAALCRFLAATLVSAGRATETSIQLFEVLAVLTMVVGNLMAIRQTQIKRMLAYSSIAHAGYLLVGVVAFLAEPTGKALSAMAYYLLGYTAMTLGAFGVVLAFERFDDKRLDLSLGRLAGAAHRYPSLGLAMAVFMFGLTGIPPTAGFFGKLSLLSAAIAAGRTSVVIVAVLASAAGAYYYLRVLVTLFMQPGEVAQSRVSSGWIDAGLGAAALSTLALGIFPSRFVEFAQQALQGWWS